MNLSLQEEWNNVEFKPGRNRDAAYDLAVVDFGSRQSLTDLVSDRPAAKAQLADELKKLKKDEDTKEPKTIRISYEGKGGLTALILMGDPGAYFAQDALRKAFCGVVGVEDQSREINLSLRGLRDVNAKTYLSWISSLAIIARFRSEVYGKKSADLKKLGAVTIHYQTSLNKRVAEECISEGRILGVCNNQVKYLADLPSNVLNPRTYLTKVQALAKQLKAECNFIDRKQLTKRGAGAFLAVIQGDLNESGGIAHLRFKGKKAKKKVSIVGKGLCFDTGGYNVKVGDYMYNMHRDMTGSAVALSLFRAMVEMDAPYEVNCYLALAENLISHEAYRPNDVVVASNGVSIEVVDTDAEGRMVLSDTLVMASEPKPDLIIDFATLTGAVVRSIDTRRCGSFSNDPKLGRLSNEVGERCGERVWNFPIGDDYNESIKSDIADVRQCANSNSADHIYASTFLSKFVGKGIPWIHIDLAADTNKGGLGLVPTDTTGFGVRFGLELIQSFLK
ncbi:MAG: leucyl aminopeptidase family protein [Bdellovibrionales bacterium]|nr:leucyl aminopeptidase family protein [Bdellovibrionales bacterium]